MVLGHGEEQIRILGMELELIDGIAMAHKVSDAVHTSRTENSDDATTASRCQDRSACITVPAPTAGVEVLIRVGVSIALEQLDAIRHDLVNGDPVVTHRGKHHWVTVRQMVVD